MLRMHREASAGRLQLTVSPFSQLTLNTDPSSEGHDNDAAQKVPLTPPPFHFFKNTPSLTLFLK